MGVALSKDSKELLKAATLGEAQVVSSCVASEPRLLKCTTLLKRSSALHIAATHGHVGVLRALVQPLLQQARQEVRSGERSGPAAKRLRKVVNARDLYYRTPLTIAAKKGRLECVRYLVESASNVFGSDREGNTCLHYAALNGHSAVVMCLLDKCRDRGIMQRLVNKRNVSGYSALQYAVWGCHKDIVQQLLLSGADYTTVNDRIFDNWVPAPIGSSALHLAVIRGAQDIALVLLEHYARRVSNPSAGQGPTTDPRRIVNIYGLDPAHLALHMQRRRMARLLRPQHPILRLFSQEQLDSSRMVGPSTLKALAAAALQCVLLDSLDKLQQQEQALHADGDEEDCCMDMALGQAQTCESSTPCVSDAARPSVAQPTSSSGRRDGRDGSGRGSREGSSRGRRGGGSNTGSASCNSTNSVVTSLQQARHAEEPRDAAQHASGCGPMQEDGLCNAAGHGQCGSSSGCNAGGDASAPPSSSSSSSSSSRDTPHVQEASGSGIDSTRMDSNQLHQQQSKPAEPANRAPRNSVSSTGPGDEADGACCVCFEELPSVQVVGCGHAVCLGCARRLSEVRGYRPPPCPLCRRLIKGFDWADSAVGALSGQVQQQRVG